MVDRESNCLAPVTRRSWLRWGLGAGLAGSALPCGQAAETATNLVWRERVMQALGTHLHLRAAHRLGEQADAGLDAAVEAINQVERQMSLFDPASALSRLNRDGILHRPTADMVGLLRLAQSVSAKSRGAFDVTVQPYWNAWRLAQQEGRLPTVQELALARSLVGWQNLMVGEQAIYFKRKGMGVTLNGIAQGYAGDLAQAALRRHGIEHALLDTGEWTALGQGPGGSPWQLGVAHPRPAAARPHPDNGLENLLATLRLERLPGRQAIATSSDMFCRFGASDLHHHIFNPATGYSPRGLSGVTVLAATGGMADALTKVMFMGDVDDALRLARLWGVDVLAVDKAGRWAASPALVSALRA